MGQKAAKSSTFVNTHASLHHPHWHHQPHHPHHTQVWKPNLTIIVTIYTFVYPSSSSQLLIIIITLILKLFFDSFSTAICSLEANLLLALSSLALILVVLSLYCIPSPLSTWITANPMLSGQDPCTYFVVISLFILFICLIIFIRVKIDHG